MEEHSQPSSSECSSLTGIHQDPWWRCRRKRLCQHRKINSREAVLVIVWVYLVSAYTFFMYATTITSQALDDLGTSSQASILAFCAIAVLSPFAGLVAGVRFGTYKVMRIGLWLMWIGSIAAVTMLTLQGLLLEHNYTVVSVSHFFPVIIAILGILHS